MDSDSLLIVLAIVAFVGMLVFALWRLHLTKDYRWIALVVVSVVLLSLTGYVLFIRTPNAGSSQTSEETSVDHEVNTVTDLTLSPVPTSAQRPTVVPTIEPQVVVEPVREEYVSHVFAADLMGLRSGAQHSLYLSDRTTSSIASVPNDEKHGYFMTSREQHEMREETGYTGFTYTDSDGESYDFSVANERIEYARSPQVFPKLSVYLEVSTDQEVGVYGVTEYWEPSAEHRANTDTCVLQNSSSDSDKMFCYWQDYELVARTTIDKQQFERGLSHVLSNGVGLVKVSLSEQMYDRLMGDQLP